MAPSSTQLRFTHAITETRPKGAGRFEFWAPKIGRRLTLFSPLQVRLWTLLEGTPWVTCYCERPAYWRHDSGKLLTDFWVRAGRREVCLIVAGESRLGYAGALSPSEDIDVRYIDAKFLASRSIWIENWMRILPYLSANARFVSTRLLKGIEQAARSAPTLGDIERDFQPHDIVLVRTAALMLLHQGRVTARSLRDRALDARTIFRRARL
ncbi:MAG: hypothetical protein K2X55_12265 [Burkholderiaceae bacterium]|nr:hypothetical protein [Burkholderiaceae bacterium]